MNARTMCAAPIAVASMTRRMGGWHQRHRSPLRTALLAVAVASTMAFIITSNAFAAIPDMAWRDRAQLAFIIFASVFSVVALQLAVLHLMAIPRQAPRALRILRFLIMVLLGTLANVLPLLFDVAPIRLGVVDSTLTGVWWSLFQSLLTATFLVHQHAGVTTSEAASRRLQELQREQRAARRRLVEAQLQALQARVDPQMFFDVLDGVQQLYTTDAARAEALLDELIVFLRAALPPLRDVSSTLAQELDLVASHFRLRSLRGEAHADVRISLPESLAPQAFPAGVILPLLAGARSAAVEVQADPGSAHDTTVSLRGERPPTEQALRQARATLAALYGAAATIDCSAAAAGGQFETRITIAHAAT